jgi:hypothetical protein
MTEKHRSLGLDLYRDRDGSHHRAGQKKSQYRDRYVQSPLREPVDDSVAPRYGYPILLGQFGQNACQNVFYMLREIDASRRRSPRE